MALALCWIEAEGSGPDAALDVEPARPAAEPDDADKATQH